MVPFVGKCSRIHLVFVLIQFESCYRAKKKKCFYLLSLPANAVFLSSFEIVYTFLTKDHFRISRYRKKQLKWLCSTLYLKN